MAELNPTDEDYCEVGVSKENGMSVIRLAGELDMVTVERVRPVVEAAVADEDERLVFDLSGLEFMDSSGIALLVSATRKVPNVEVRDPTPIVRRLIELTGLTAILLMVP